MEQVICTLHLNYDDYELDMRTGTVMINRTVWDGFVKDGIIWIHFNDENGEPVNEYMMKGQDSEFIYCEFINAVM